MSSSWKLESSQTIHASGGASTPAIARPTLPATATSRPAARHAGALDQHVGALEERDVLVVPQLTVDGHDLDAVPIEQCSRGLPRAGHAEDDGALHPFRTRPSSGSTPSPTASSTE